MKNTIKPMLFQKTIKALKTVSNLFGLILTVKENSSEETVFKKRHSQHPNFLKKSSFAVFVFFAGLFINIHVDAQISYSAARSTGIIYSSISSSGTSFTSWKNGTSTDDNLSGSTPIGFNFNYNGAVFTSFSISTNGFITFNTTTTEVGSGIGAYGYSNSAFSSSSSNSVLSLAPLYDDLVCVGNLSTAASLSSSMKYRLTGSSPNRILTVEWIGFEVYANAGPSLNFQVKLYETTNKIDFWYGTMTASTAAYSYSLGLNSSTISTAPTATELYSQQTVNSATFGNTPSNALATVPATNTKIVFTPVVIPCAAAPSALAYSGLTASSATITWTAASSTPSSGYEYYLSTSATAPTSTTSPTGSVGAGILTANLIGLIANTTYYFWVRSNCGTSKSGWTGSSSFLTLCNSVTINTSTSFTENFNSGSSSIGCWRSNGSGISFVTAGIYPTCAPQEGDQMIQYNSYNLSAASQARLISMSVNSSGTTGLAVDFYWLNENSPYYTMLTEGVQVQYSLDGGATWINSGSFFPRQDNSLVSGATQWNLKTVEIGSPAVSGNVLIGFLFTSQFGDNCFLDNVKIRQATPIISSFSPMTSCVGSSVTISGAHFNTTTSVKFNGLNASSFSVLSATQLTAIVPVGATSGAISVTTLTGGTGISSASITISALPVVTASASATTICSGNSVTLTGGGAPAYSWSGGISNGVSFIPLSTTSYTVTGTSSGGCSSTASITIVVVPQPVVNCPSAITVNLSPGACDAIVTYTANSTTIPAPTITYSPLSGSLFTIGTTPVTVTATTSEGCTSSCTFLVTVVSSGASSWSGSVNSDWFNPGNWCGGIPTATSDVIISSGAPNMPLINTSGAVLKNLTINSGGSLTLDGAGNLSVFGNWVNNGTFIANSGNVGFNGSVAQSLTGPTTFYALTLNNSFGLTINSNVIVNQNCSLDAGVLSTGSNILQITNGGTLATIGGHVNGYLKKFIDMTPDYITFEVGSNTGYTPLTIYFNNVTVAGYLTVNTISTDHPSLATSGLNPARTINRYWNLNASGLIFDYYNLGLSFLSTDIDAGFITEYAGAKIYNGSSWNLTTPDYSGTNSLLVNNVTSLGSVQIGVYNPTPVALSLLPNHSYAGITSNIILKGQGFIAGVSSVCSAPGITINSTTVNNDSTLTLNISVSATAVSGIRKFAVSNICNAIGFGGASDSLTFTVRKKPVVNFYANYTSIICNSSGSVEFTNYSTDGESYTWDFGSGASPSTATGNGPFTVMYSTTGLKTIKLVATSPLGSDSLMRVNYINVGSAAPSTTLSISGPLNLSCTSSAVTGVYVAPLKPDVYYNWTVPVGSTIVSGAGTRAIVVSFSGSFTSGVISLTESNGCGTSVAKTIAITKSPTAPASISGSTVLCGLTSATYTVATTPGATSYTWTLPSGVTSSAGTSPITTTSTTLTVNIASTFNSGTLSVKANNACTSSAPKTLAIRRAPATPASISGSAIVCNLTTSTYTVSSTVGATSYTWTLPSGVTASGGLSVVTTTGTSLTVNFSSSFTSGSISVKASNACSSSGPRSFAIKTNPNIPGAISGPINICSLTSATYSISPVAGASSYTWSLPTGIISTTGASSITTTSTSITVSILPGVGSGDIAVVSNNSCGSSDVRLKALTGCHSHLSNLSDSIPVQVLDAKIYPNPAIGSFNVEYSCVLDSKFKIEIYDDQGRLVFSKEENTFVGNNTFSQDISNLNSGVYFVKLYDSLNNLFVTKKLVIQN